MSGGWKSVVNGKPALWALLALPAVSIAYRFFSEDIWPGDLLHPSGEWSARMMIFALMLTPLSMLFKGRRWIGWLVARRRAFGVAAFLYALLHLVLYVLDMETVRAMLDEFRAPGIWTGWAALALLLPLGLTSNDAARRRLKAGWKRLQRLAYPAALLTLAHWLFVHDGSAGALAHFAPLVLLEAWRIARSWRGHRPRPNPSTAF